MTMEEGSERCTTLKMVVSQEMQVASRSSKKTRK